MKRVSNVPEEKKEETMSDITVVEKESAEVKELVNQLQDLDRRRMEIKEEARAVREKLNQVLKDEQYDFWGVNEEQYIEAKNNAYPHYEAERRYHEALVRRKKLEDRSNDDRKSEDVKTEARKALESEEYSDDNLEKLRIEVEEAKKGAKPLSVALNELRRKNAKAMRQSQTATTTPVTTKTRAK